MTQRLPADYAIEFGRYLAVASEAFMAECNRTSAAGKPINGDVWSSLQSAIYEFRKRADRAGASPDRVTADARGD